MIRVQVRPNEPLEAALRRFKRQCNYAGIFRLAKKYTSYEKRSDKRRREERERIRNIQRAMRKLEFKTRKSGPRKAKGRGAGQGGDGVDATADAGTGVPAIV
jgi:small subunit ribosomal protein S21